MPDADVISLDSTLPRIRPLKNGGAAIISRGSSGCHDQREKRGERRAPMLDDGCRPVRWERAASRRKSRPFMTTSIGFPAWPRTRRLIGPLLGDYCAKPRRMYKLHARWPGMKPPYFGSAERLQHRDSTAERGVRTARPLHNCEPSRGGYAT